MSISVCSGADGLTPKLHFKYWDVVGIDITSVGNYLFQSGRYHVPWLRGLFISYQRGRDLQMI